MRTATATLLVCVFLCWFAHSAPAAYEIAPSVIAGGGGSAAGGSYQLSGTLGQAAIGITQGPSNRAEIGFWYQPGWVLTGIEEDLFPTRFHLDQNYPNPFNPVTTLRFGVPKKSRVVVTLYSVSGREVRTLIDEDTGPGYHDVTIDGATLPSGVYFCRMEAGTFSDTRKLILLK